MSRLNRGYSDKRDIASIGIHVDVQLKSGETFTLRTVDRPSNHVYSCCIIEDDKQIYKTKDEVKAYEDNKLEILNIIDPQDVLSYSLQFNILDTSHGRMIRKYENTTHSDNTFDEFRSLTNKWIKAKRLSTKMQ